MRSDTPSWWTTDHDSRWDRVKAAFRRDWEQTRHDFGSDEARDLRQNAADTVKQAAGSTDGHRPFDQLEPAFRYGHGARSYYGDWNDEVEAKLMKEYAGDYSRDREYIRRGYDYPPPL